MADRNKGTGTPPEIPARRELIQEEVGCRRCGYLLKGLTVSGVCPECGTAIQGWLGTTDRLFTSRPGSIWRMQWAIYLFMATLLLGCMDLFVMAFRAEGMATADGVGRIGVWQAHRVAEGLEWVRLNSILWTVPALLTMCLVPYAAGTADVRLRVYRLAAMTALGVAWLGAALMVVRYATVGWSVPMVMEPKVMAVAFLMWCVGLALMMPCMREVARRMRQKAAQGILRVLQVQAWCVITIGAMASAMAHSGVDLTTFRLVIVLWGAGVLVGFLWALVLIAGELGREADRSEIYHNEMEEMELSGR